ncbi:hypothetical protein [Bradyrhizobium cosmicum]|uniref:hypothetical protein n=1 Tax=Bradyrhizobium cosmicum TaxID=1404864 RepID=UPI001165B9EC|nr:hypothetical protein [Bradyrhizobium cosmicum]QDP21198.1 hypothetical protein FNV92_03030 [Bradyrhizobium cosmicum]
MSSTLSQPDGYATRLEAQGKALEAEQESLAVRIEKWRSAVEHYAEHLREQGLPVPAFVKLNEANSDRQKRQVTPETYDPLTRVVKIAAPRIGGKRKEVLVFIAKATKAGRSVSSREIVDYGNYPLQRVMNVLMTDKKRGYLTSINGVTNTGPGRAYQYQMTMKGFDFLRQAGVDINE